MPSDLEVQVEELLAKSINLKLKVEEILLAKFQSSKNKSDGFTKYSTSIKSEIKFLNSLISHPENIKDSHIHGSNYIYLNAVYQVIRNENCHHIFKSINFKTNGMLKSIRIDVIADRGSRWIKVKAGTLSALEREFSFHECDDFDDESDSDSDFSFNSKSDFSINDRNDQKDLFDMQSSFGKSNIVAELTMPDPPIIKQAKILLEAAKQNLIHFKGPAVVFKFVALEALPQTMIDQLLPLGVIIEFGTTEAERKLDEYYYLTRVLNLDITTLLAMISDITFRFNDISIDAFDCKPLKLQYDSEQTRPILPVLNEMMKERELVTTQAAFDKFKTIVHNIGGPIEQQRAASLFNTHGCISIPTLDPQPKLGCSLTEISVDWKVFVIENHPSDHFRNLSDCKLKDYNLDIFGTGDYLGISTITANAAIRRSLEKCGHEYAIESHEPRGLIEQKWINCSK